VPIPHTTRFRRGKLPHWEVERGRYFVTVRLADSLPVAAIERLQEITRHLSATEPASAQFVALQRRYFQTMEKYLEVGVGACWLGEPRCAEAIITELDSLAEVGVEVPHRTIMPNHWHALLVPGPACRQSLADVMKRIKGRTGKGVRTLVAGSGPVWQREWFDRWIRDETEWDRVVAYIRNNPVKAGLAPRWHDHPWTK